MAGRSPAAASYPTRTDEEGPSDKRALDPTPAPGNQGPGQVVGVSLHPSDQLDMQL